MGVRFDEDFLDTFLLTVWLMLIALGVCAFLVSVFPILYAPETITQTAVLAFLLLTSVRVLVNKGWNPFHVLPASMLLVFLTYYVMVETTLMRYPHQTGYGLSSFVLGCVVSAAAVPGHYVWQFIKPYNRPVPFPLFNKKLD
jgi:hypothetical protein